jgi:hypothetical protein
MIINSDTIFHCDHEYYNNYLLKPDESLYSTIISNIKQKRKIQSRDTTSLECIFVDDTLMNLLPILSDIKTGNQYYMKI